MVITKETWLKDILKEYPWLKDALIKKLPKIKPLFGPLGKPLLNTGTIEDISRIVGKQPEWLIKKLNEIIEGHRGED